jgi:hypothetical protein
MTEELLNKPYFGSVFEHMGCASVPEKVTAPSPSYSRGFNKAADFSH